MKKALEATLGAIIIILVGIPAIPLAYLYGIHYLAKKIVSRMT